jgi:biopolymer transport protein ExbB
MNASSRLKRRPRVSRLSAAIVLRLVVGCALLALCALATRPRAATAEEGGDASTARPGEAAPGGEPQSEQGLGRSRRIIEERKIPTRLSEMFVAGDWPMWPIAACSIVALAFAVERLVVLRRRRVIPRDFVTRFLSHLEQGQLDRASALQLCEENGSPVAEVFAHGVRKWGKPSVEVEQAIIDGGERQVGYLRKHLRVLNSVATIAPLLGLLGTVYGMIKCFNQIASSPMAMGKSEHLAYGIGIALICTAAGLVVAIPTMTMHMYLGGRVDSLIMEMDSLAQKVVNLISAEGLAAPITPMPRIAPRPKTIGTSAVKNS